MTCTGCGAALKSEVRFCPHCGTRVPDAPPAPSHETINAIGRGLRDGNARALSEWGPRALDDLVHRQLGVVREVLSTPEARALGAEIRAIDDAAGAPVAKALGLLGQVLKGRSAS